MESSTLTAARVLWCTTGEVAGALDRDSYPGLDVITVGRDDLGVAAEAVVLDTRAFDGDVDAVLEGRPGQIPTHPARP